VSARLIAALILTACVLCVLRPGVAIAEPCPAPPAAELLVDGKLPKKAGEFPYRRARTRVGEVISIDIPFDTCSVPGVPDGTRWENSVFTALAGQGRPALGHGLRWVGSSGVTQPSPRGTGLVWPLSVALTGPEWLHRVIELEVTRPGRYYVNGGSTQTGYSTKIGYQPPPEPTPDPPTTYDRRNVYVVGIEARPAPKACGALVLRGGDARIASSRKVVRRHADLRAAFRVKRRGLGCVAVESLMERVLSAKDETLALRQAGFGITGFSRARVRGKPAYRVRARAGGSAIAYTRFRSLRVDHSIYRAGQDVKVFVRIDADDGRPYYSRCTAGFAFAVPGLPGPVGSTAGHCVDAAVRGAEPISVVRGFSDASQFEPLGNILSHVGNGDQGVDAASFSIFFNWGVAQQIERGELPPLTVTGSVATSAAGLGTRVCFAGRTSGADQCGRVIDKLGGMPPELTCTDIGAAKGDSGGPVYLVPNERLATRAVGIVSQARKRGRRNMCFTPIDDVAAALGAGVPAGPMVREAQPGQVGVF
jgi:hypothetical protein